LLHLGGEASFERSDLITQLVLAILTYPQLVTAKRWSIGK
jgi:hypothetical protein